jgi:subtilase family serine protease
MTAMTASLTPDVVLASEPTLTIAGARSAALSAASDLGATGGDTVVTARLLLARQAARQAAFDHLTQAQQDPSSPLYHRWLTAAEIGTEFGPSSASIAKTTSWLAAQGLTVGVVSPAGTSITFSGPASTVQSAFKAPVHAYRVRGHQVNAFSADPQIPATLAGDVAGLAGLGGSRPEPLVRPMGPVVRDSNGAWHKAVPTSGVTPNLTTTVDGVAQQDVAPPDFATIYNVTRLRFGQHPLTGFGQTVGIVEDSDMNRLDWVTFRSVFQLTGNAGLLIATHPGCSDPGTNVDEAETALDAEWVTAVAPAAAILVSSCSDASGGIQAALQGLINLYSPPRVISVSFGECESQFGASAAASWSALLQQAAAEGVSVFVSTGDTGSAGCESGTSSTAQNGIAVNGLASTAYNVAVGGTDFSDMANNTVSNYWNSTNSTTYGSAKSYIPEIPWNDTCANPVLATYEGSAGTLSFCNTATGRGFLAPGGGGGGASMFTTKPSFQSTALLGMPNDGARDIPDVSLFASNGVFGHALIYCMSNTAQGGSACNYTNGASVSASSAGGTSFAAPAFAAIQALIDQKKGATQGNPAARLYALAAAQFNTAGTTCNASNGPISTTCLFHDITTGGNDQACRNHSPNCYTDGRNYGVLSQSSSTESDAYGAATGYDLATGLGSVDVTNLVNAY